MLKVIAAQEEEDDGLPFACAICRGPFTNPIETKFVRNSGPETGTRWKCATEEGIDTHAAAQVPALLLRGLRIEQLHQEQALLHLQRTDARCIQQCKETYCQDQEVQSRLMFWVEIPLGSFALEALE
jgi:hypothetical protein